MIINLPYLSFTMFYPWLMRCFTVPGTCRQRGSLKSHDMSNQARAASSAVAIWDRHAGLSSLGDGPWRWTMAIMAEGPRIKHDSWLVQPNWRTPSFFRGVAQPPTRNSRWSQWNGPVPRLRGRSSNSTGHFPYHWYNVGPPVVNWFRFAPVTIVIIINQLSYLGGPTLYVCWVVLPCADDVAW